MPWKERLAQGLASGSQSRRSQAALGVRELGGGPAESKGWLCSSWELGTTRGAQQREVEHRKTTGSVVLKLRSDYSCHSTVERSWHVTLFALLVSSDWVLSKGNPAEVGSSSRVERNSSELWIQSAAEFLPTLL